MNPLIEPTLTIDPAPGREHVPAEGARAPEGAVQVDVEDVEPMLVGDIFRGRLAARDAGVVDEDVDPAMRRDDVRRRLSSQRATESW